MLRLERVSKKHNVFHKTQLLFIWFLPPIIEYYQFLFMFSLSYLLLRLFFSSCLNGISLFFSKYRLVFRYCWYTYNFKNFQHFHEDINYDMNLFATLFPDALLSTFHISTFRLYLMGLPKVQQNGKHIGLLFRWPMCILKNRWNIKERLSPFHTCWRNSLWKQCTSFI